MVEQEFRETGERSSGVISRLGVHRRNPVNWDTLFPRSLG